MRCYIRFVAEFAKHFNQPPDQLGSEEIRTWQLHLLNERWVKLSTYIQPVCSLRFFYQNTLHRKVEIERILLPRYERKLPVILSQDEVKALLEAPRNLKHRAILATIYAAGLRASEVTNLKVTDLDRERRVIWVRGGKGQKDRQVMLSEPLREVLTAYWRWKRPADWLFPGGKAGSPMDRGRVFRICREAANVAGVAKPSHPHSLRHAFATHLLHEGVNLPVIQALLGHKHLVPITSVCSLNLSRRRVRPKVPACLPVPGSRLEMRVAAWLFLDSQYVIDLRFSKLNAPVAGNQEPTDPPPDAALPQQLGLRLERHKGRHMTITPRLSADAAAQSGSSEASPCTSTIYSVHFSLVEA